MLLELEGAVILWDVAMTAVVGNVEGSECDGEAAVVVGIVAGA